MLINTSYFNPGSNMGNSANNYRYLRNVVSHEHGHGVGSAHVTPCTSTKLMEPFIWTSLGPTGHDMLQFDEIRIAGRNYGDRYSGNSSAAAAVDYGDLASPLRSVVERDLSTNGAAGGFNSDEDWFGFTLSSAQPVTITVDPTGGTYQNGEQDTNCTTLQELTVVAENAGNLNIELRDGAGTTVLQTANAAGPGQIETLAAGTLPAGTYKVRVFDVGPNSATNQIVQLYDMALRVGPGAGGPANPVAIAGVNKRIAANTNCVFMGNINSAATEPGATIPSNGYHWDLNGDGVFEVNHPQPVRQYVSNGVYPAVLRVTDSNGRQATDSITVTVFGATTTVTGVTPPSGAQGETVPVVITGTNLKNVTSLSHLLVAGGGVSIIGTPTPNFEGTQVSGISLVIAPAAAPGPRNVNVTNPDGSAVGEGAFTVTTGGPACPADWNDDGQVNSSDISAYLTSWLDSVQNGNLIADFDHSNSVNSSDISEFLTAWLAAASGGC